MFLPGINGRRHKSIDSVCFKLYYAGLSVESEERKLSMTPTSKPLRADRTNEQYQLKYIIKKGEIFNLAPVNSLSKMS